MALGHVGRLNPSLVTPFDPMIPKEYFPIACHHDPRTNRFTLPRIMATRKDFHDSAPAKRPALYRVVYNGGANIDTNDIERGEHYLHSGVGDACAFDSEIDGKFLKSVIDQDPNSKTT